MDQYNTKYKSWHNQLLIVTTTLTPELRYKIMATYNNRKSGCLQQWMNGIVFNIILLSIQVLVFPKAKQGLCKRQHRIWLWTAISICLVVLTLSRSDLVAGSGECLSFTVSSSAFSSSISLALSSISIKNQIFWKV